jgi:hypothetical protein
MIPAETQALLQRIISHAYSDYCAERNEAVREYHFKMARQRLINSSAFSQGGIKIYRDSFAKFVRNMWALIEKTLEEIGYDPDEKAEVDLYNLLQKALIPLRDLDDRSFAGSFANRSNPKPNLHANRTAQLARLETQITIFVKKIRAMKTNPKMQSGNQINYYLQGPNSRVNIHSQDNSHNVVINEGELFTKLREAIESAEVDGNLKKQLLDKVEEGKALQQQHGLLKGWFGDFMALASDCITVVQPFVPALAALIAQH